MQKVDNVYAKDALAVALNKAAIKEDSNLTRYLS